MKVANNLPQQVQSWVAQARKTDQTAGDKDARPDSIDWSGPGMTLDDREDRLTAVKGKFDEKGPLSASLKLDSHVDAFWVSQYGVKVERQGDMENYAVRLHHPRDPQAFDFRASFSRDVNSGEVKDYQFLPGPPSGFALAKEILTDKGDLAVIGGATVLGSVSGLLTSAIAPGLGATNGALFGAGFGALCGYLFSLQERAYGI